MTRYTVDDVMNWRPCEDYDRERIVELFAGRESVDEFDVASLVGTLPQEDIGWALGHMLPWRDDFVFPDGVTYLRVLNNQALTELHIPDGVTDLWVENNPALTELHVPDGVTSLRVENNGN